MSNVKTAMVVLNYNDNKDLFELLPLLERQSIKSTIIIIDNDSSKENKEQIYAWIEKKESFYVGQKHNYYQEEFDKNKDYYLVYNDWDAGFSGGNNVGMRVAYLLGIDYALLISPDVRLYDDDYMKTMLKGICMDKDIVVAGSNILDINGQQQSPMRLITFKEEAFWFLPYLPFVKKKNNIFKVTSTYLLEQETIHGCCMLFDIVFLNQIGYLDERVFMYCEEPILAARVKNEGKKIVYIPETTAVHEHIRSKKINSSLRMKDFFESRKYYIKYYSDYTRWQKGIILISYGICELLHRIKYYFEMKGRE